MSRWAELSWPERHMVHHALRVLLTHPAFNDAMERGVATSLADEIWGEHCERVNECDWKMADTVTADGK